MTLLQDSHRWDYLIQSWSPGTDRLSLGTWFLIAGYFLSSSLCLRKGRASLQESAPRRRWFLQAGILSGIGVARLLTLEEAITVAFRDLVVLTGFYDYRRFLQVPFIAASLLVAGGLAWRTVRSESFRNGDLVLSMIGTLVAVDLFAVRACSFHYTDRLLGIGWRFVHLGGAIELVCIALATLGALRPSESPPRNPSSNGAG